MAVYTERSQQPKRAVPGQAWRAVHDALVSVLAEGGAGGLTGGCYVYLRAFRYTLTEQQWSTVRDSTFFKQQPHLRLPPLDGISNTLRASYRSGHKLYSQFVRTVGGDAVRFFTPRECARIMGFPETFRLSGLGNGHIAEVSQYHALGNAITPPVVQAIARSIVSMIS